MTFDIRNGENATIVFIGRLDAAQCARAQAHIDSALDRTEFDFSELEYISSAGLGLLLKVQKRLLSNGQRLRVRHVSSHIYDIFRYSGFDQIFDVERV